MLLLYDLLFFAGTLRKCWSPDGIRADVCSPKVSGENQKYQRHIRDLGFFELQDSIALPNATSSLGCTAFG
jgi:hypothetical protein